MNKYWEENNGIYGLHFTQFYDDEVILKFARDKEDVECFWYVSELLNVENDCEFCNSVEEAKDLFEYKIESYIEEQISYYKDMLSKWNEK